MNLKHAFISIFTLSISFFSAVSLAQSQPAFWTLTKEGHAPLTILGSIHVGTDALYPMPPVLTKAFLNATTLVVEVDTLNMPANEIKATTQLINLPNQQKLADVMPIEQYRALKATLKELNLNVPRVKSMQPWFVIMTAMQLKLNKMGYQADLGIDVHYLKLAQQQAKPVMQLENVQKQLWYLSQIGQHQPKAIETGLKELSELGQWAPKMLSHWAKGELVALHTLLTPTEQPDPEQDIFSQIMQERNQDWQQQLLKLPAEQSAFVVVGALHLTGSHNLIELLEQQGYQAQRHSYAAQP
ncbi:TraB/GumN family protein [Motilimonas eburnea]|uniref:TraB/GumN family protein n=1 Tax=Motilimonas eburnea TaxID=1737488 RepID=UPI001E2D4754|nr:TraB/GumN family protein [Motilimonas eburnea]MCE2571574.1 TraB/GumN family protein [Motilimonas eburnea]